MPATLSAQPSDIFCQPIECGTFPPAHRCRQARIPGPVLPSRALAAADCAKGDRHPEPHSRDARRHAAFLRGGRGDTVLAAAGDAALCRRFPSARPMELSSAPMCSCHSRSVRAQCLKRPISKCWPGTKRTGTTIYYKLDRQGASPGQQVWKIAATSRNVDALSPDQRSGTCLACHANGVPVMKELLFPWNNWHSDRLARDLLDKSGPAELRWPVRTNRTSRPSPRRRFSRARSRMRSILRFSANSPDRLQVSPTANSLSSMRGSPCGRC